MDTATTSISNKDMPTMKADDIQLMQRTRCIMLTILGVRLPWDI